MGLTTFINCLIIFAGGGLGALSRFGVEHIGIFDNNKYYYTVAINITGCLTIGILWALFHYWHLSRGWYLGIITGFLGGYTTYSAFSLDAMQLVQDGQWWRAAFYVTITIVGGLGACAVGLFTTEKLLKMI